LEAAETQLLQRLTHEWENCSKNILQILNAQRMKHVSFQALTHHNCNGSGVEHFDKFPGVSKNPLAVMRLQRQIHAVQRVE